MSTPHDFFRLNVGFIIHQTVGYSRDFPLDAPSVTLLPDLELINLAGEARVTRAAQGLLVQVKLAALTHAACARCLEDCLTPLETEFTELYAFTPAQAAESGFLVPESGKIDLEPLVRDEMLLAVPINSLCRPDCRGLCPVCGENLNTSACEHNETPMDSRLEALYSLLGGGEDRSEQ